MSKEVMWNRAHWSSGQLMFETPWVNNQVHGIARGWHSNGQLHWEIPYVNGQRHGIGRDWNSNGQLFYVAKWHMNQRIIGLGFDSIPSDAMMGLDLITNILSY